jgi:hypothetical protein
MRAERSIPNYKLPIVVMDSGLARCAPQSGMTKERSEATVRAKRVGWVERSDTHHAGIRAMGFAFGSTHPTALPFPPRKQPGMTEVRS